MFFNRRKLKKLYIPFDEGAEGGVSTFLKNLRRYLDKIKYPYTVNVKEGSSIFFPVATKLEDIKYIKSKGGKVIQRLDGIYYPTQHGDEYLSRNEPIKNIYQNYADFIVFQSEYSKKQCVYMFGEKTKSEYTLILNGVDNSIFFPSQSHVFNKKIKFVSTGNFRKTLMLEPIIKALELLQSDGILFEYHIVGKVIPEITNLLERNFVTYHGEKEAKYIAELLRNSDALLHSQLNDLCPNSVIEAIGTGLPVVAFNSGGVRELLSFSEDTLAEVNSCDLFHLASDLDYKNYYNKIKYLIKNFENLKKRALGHVNDYALEVMGAKYVEVFNKFLER